MSSQNILVVAGEASSSLYAQRLLEHWQKQGRSVQAFGVGSQQMADLGFDCIGRSEDLAVVGIQEVLSNFSLIRTTFHRLLDEAKKRNTKVALLLDYPDFNLRLAKKLKSQGVKVVYYISPQLWAWRKGRIKIIKKYVDLMLVLFPFEKDFYEANGVPVKFVGHQYLDELSSELFEENSVRLARARYGFQPEDVVLGLMPGSRNSEIKHHLDTQLLVAKNLLRKHSNLKVALLVAPSLNKDELQLQLSQYDLDIVVVKRDPTEMLQITDMILCASGTATLVTGLMHKPMVIMYKMNAFTAFLAKRLVTSTPFFGMVNLIFGRLVAPEFFQEAANVEQLSRQLETWIVDAGSRNEKAKELSKLSNLLGERGATQRVAEALTGFLQ